MDSDNGYWQLSMVHCSEFPAVTQSVWQGGLRKPDGWSRKPDDCSRSMRKMPRSLQNLSKGSLMLDGWSKLSRMCFDNLDSLYRCCPEHLTVFQHAESWRMFGTFQNSWRTRRYMQNLARRCRMHLRLLQITTGITTALADYHNFYFRRQSGP